MREFRGDEFRGSEPVFGPLESEEKTPPFVLEMMEAALVVATGAAPDQAGRCPLQLTCVKAHGAGLCCARCRAGALAQRWLHGGLWQGLQAVHVEVLRLGQNEPHSGGQAGRSDSRGSRCWKDACAVPGAAGRLDAELLAVSKRVGKVLQRLPRDITPVNLEELRRVKQSLVELESKADTLRCAWRAWRASLQAEACGV